MATRTPIASSLRERIAKRALSRCRREGPCLIYLGGTDKDGYPKTTTSVKGVRVDLRLHRVVLEYKMGRRLPVGRLACHRCDRASCLEPSHLFSGNAATNMQDKVKKGRHRAPGPTNPARGIKNTNAKLTPAVVRRIRRASGTLKSIAEWAGVSVSTVGKIRNNQLWTQVK